MSPAAAPPLSAAAEGSSTSSASPNQAPVAPSDSPATFQTAPAEPPSSTGADSDELLSTLGAPLGTGSSGSAAEHEAELTPAAAAPAAAEQTADEPASTTTTAAKVEPASAPVAEPTPATAALPTATTSTTTAAAAPDTSKAAAAGPTPAAPAAGASSSSPTGPTRQAASTAAAQPARAGKKKKKGALASLLASVFFCFPSDDGAYDGGKKPAAGGANGPPRAPAGADQASSAAKKASKESSATSSAGEKKVAGSEPLRQITSRELMAVDTTPAAGKDAERTPKPPALALPVPTTPLNTKRSASNLEAGGDVVIPPPTPTSPPIDETAGLTSSAVVPPGSGTLIHSHHHHSQTSSHAPTPTSSPKLGAADPATSADESFSATDSEVSGSDAGGAGAQRYDDSQADEQQQQQRQHELDEEDEEDEDEDAHLLGGVGIPIGPDGKECPLLPPMAAVHKGRKCLVLDLDETLLHSSFKLIPQADYIVPVEIESQTHNVYVIKRPGVDNFLKKMGEIYEVVVFTASLSKYADPVLDMLDVHHVVSHRLFRESCYNHKGNYVKDLSQLGRPIDETIIIDNSPASYIFHPNNAVPVSTWFNDPHDSELSDLIMFLADLANVEDVRGVLDGGL